MRCSKCKKPVPAWASPGDEAGACCADCRGAAAERTPPTANPGAADSDFAATLSAIPLDWDDWELDEDFLRVGRLSGPSAAPAESQPAFAPVAASAPSVDRRSNHPVIVSRGSAGRQFISWTVLSLSLMIFVCGAVLVGWSFYAGRFDLWRLGAPLTLIGQTGWLIALVLQLDGLWQGHRDTSQALQTLDGRLHELRQATELLSSARCGASQTFYAHMADGAAPHILLADLKGQLDLLATQLQQRRAA